MRVEPDALARGAVFWQASNCAFEVIHFASRSDTAPVASRTPDVHRQWVEFWGSDHMHHVTGASRSGSSGTMVSSVRFYERLHVGSVVPGDLVLDPDHHPGRSRFDIGANLQVLGIKATRAGRRR